MAACKILQSLLPGLDALEFDGVLARRTRLGGSAAIRASVERLTPISFVKRSQSWEEDTNW
jgi:hypothetical protein